MGRRTYMFAAVLVAAALVGGCTAKTAVLPEAPSAAPDTATAPASAVRAMTIEQKRQLIAPNFQPEVPVPLGEVVRGKAQGDVAWDYEILVAAPPAAVAGWYQQAYVGREWQVAEQSSPSEGAFTITMTKNAAQTRVTILPEGEGSSRVVAVLGVGAPVLQTQ